MTPYSASSRSHWPCALLPIIVGLVAICVQLVSAAAADARGLSCKAQSRAPMRLCGVETDNYKDCYNGSAHAGPDLRTWVVWSTLQARAASWKLVDGTPQFSDTLNLRRISGRPSLPRTATLSVETIAGPVSIANFRHGPPTGRWGVLLTLSGRDALRAGPAHLRIVLRGPDGGVLSSLGLRYAFDPAIFNAPADSPEFNGPGGRWVVHRTATKTDIEGGVKHAC